MSIVLLLAHCRAFVCPHAYTLAGVLGRGIFLGELLKVRDDRLKKAGNAVDSIVNTRKDRTARRSKNLKVKLKIPEFYYIFFI